MTDAEKYDMEQKRDRVYYQWANKQLDIIPELASRVFALRSKLYMGCGVHYSMEQNLGNVISRLNNHDYYDTSVKNMMWRTCTEIKLKMLITSVARAEASVKEHAEEQSGYKQLSLFDNGEN